MVGTIEAGDLNQLLVFTRVVQAGSFTAAAHALGMPKSTVSRKVRELEDRIGARLLQRTTRKLGLTDAGRSYYEHAARIVTEIEEAELAVSHMQSAPRGLLRVTAPLTFSMLAPIVSELLRRHPELRLEMSCTDRTVDLVEEGYDLGIRAGVLDDSSLVSRSLGTIERVLVAAPGYCAVAGIPEAPADLARHACISFSAGSAPNRWVLHAGDERVEVQVKPRISVNDFEIMGQAARDGLGIAWMPAFGCAADLAAGRLRRVLPSWSSAATPVQVVYPTARHLTPKVHAFVDLLRERFSLRVKA